jgi:hypothetical protein
MLPLLASCACILCHFPSLSKRKKEKKGNKKEKKANPNPDGKKAYMLCAICDSLAKKRKMKIERYPSS